MMQDGTMIQTFCTIERATNLECLKLLLVLPFLLLLLWPAGLSSSPYIKAIGFQNGHLLFLSVFFSRFPHPRNALITYTLRILYRRVVRFL